MDDSSFDTDIAVVGMAGRFAGARNIHEYWNNLRDGVESLSTFSEDELLAAGVDPAQLADPNYVPVGAVMPDMEMFDAKFFGFSPKEASILDPQHRHFLECAWEALENAGHLPEKFGGSIGMFGGSGHNAYMPYNLMTNPGLMSSVGFFLVRHTGNDKDFLTTRVSYLLNLRGPSVNVQTACSTSLVAIHLGVQSLLNRECDMALAGGVTIEMPHRHGYLYRENEILSPDGHCRAFDADSKGTVFGSGVGVVVLRRLSDAVADGDFIHAVIKGSALNNDGSQKVGYMAPSVDGQAQAIAEALAVANVEPDTITYLASHGTGTPVGDPIEVAALSQAYRQGTDKTGYCGIGSVKTNIGHTDTAAGVASFIAVAMAMRAKQLPPSLHFKAPNPACDFDGSPFYVNAALKAWQPPQGMPRRAGVSSLGVGGTNAHIVMEEAPRRGDSGPSRPFQVLVQSAKTLTALDAGSLALAEHFKAQPGLNLADTAHTLQIGRQAMKHRRVLVVSSAADAVQALAAALAKSGDPQRVFNETATDGSPRSIAFMFAGGGAQYPNMGLDLYRGEPVFRAAVDECLQILLGKLKSDIRPLLFPAEGQEAQASEQLQRPSLALPALLTVQYAQAKLWMSWGIQPSAMVGHSMGEYTAAHLAGVFSLADALTLVELRGRLFETLPEGAMLSVPMAEAELKPLLPPELSIAVINGPRMTVAAGPVHAVESLQTTLAAMEIEAARVRINVAAHSSMLEPILAEFGAFFQRIAMKPPTLPFVSNLSGTWITPAEATDPQYWVRHLRNTVRFADGLQELLKDESRVLLEVGPGRTLSSLARQHPARKPQQTVLNAMRHPDEQLSDQAFMLGVFGRLWAVGVEVDWAKLRGDEKRLRVELPTYRFDHQRHWVEPGKGAGVLPPEERSLHKRKDIAEWFYQPVWKRTATPALLPAPVDANGATTVSRCLIFADTLGFGERLAQRLRERGDEVTLVFAGKSYRRESPQRFTINARSGGEVQRLLATLNGEGKAPQRLVHLWTLTGQNKPAAGLAAAEEMQHLGFYSLLHLAQAIGSEDLADSMRLAVITDHLQRVTSETGLVPAKATVLGPCKVIPREFHTLRCPCIDIELPQPGSRQEQLLLDALVAEIDGDPKADDDVVAYRSAQRWVQSHEAMPLAGVNALHAAPLQRLRERGTYLITGGLGGVGLTLAEHLARTVKARLVLVGRSGLPERAEWPRVLAAPDTLPSTAQRIRKVMALEALGAEVMVAAADITHLAQMKAVVKQARARFGDIHGVLHTAGVLNDGVVQLKEAQVAASVLAPKLQGTLVLEAALADAQGKSHQGAPLDFVVLFSSISAFAGLAGQVDYAAANAFLDAYAQERFARDATFTVAVNWSQWQEVGMAAELAHQLGLSADALADEVGETVGEPLIERRLLDSADERVYTTRFGLKSHWLLDEHRVRGGEALIPGTGYLEIARSAFTQKPAPAGTAQTVELRNVTFLAPFVVRADEERDLRIHIRSRAKAASPFSIVSRSAGEAYKDQAWTENVRGTVAYVDAAAPAAADLAAIAARCKLRTQVGQEAPLHLLFGPRWSNIQRIDFGAGEALARLDLPAAFAGDLERFPLHPALMDMATAGAQALVPNFDEARDFFVPASYGQLRVFAPLNAQFSSHIRYLGNGGDNDDAPGAQDLAVYDVTLLDEQGRVLVDIHEFTMIRVRDKALLGRVEPGTAGAGTQAAHKPRATANNILSVGLRDGILNAEGTEVLDRVLAWGAGPQIVVSPQDLVALQAQLRLPPAGHAHADAQDLSAEGDSPGFKAPSTATEKLIAQMWGEMLGHGKVSATDDFFDLGGHSLLAVQVINKLKKKTGKALPLTALLEAPTVQALAALIEPPGATHGDDPAAAGAAVPAPVRSATLVPLRPGSNERPPIFLVHDGLGETLLYRNLALQLQPGHTVYGIQPEVDAQGRYVQTRISDWASAHIRSLRSVQPQGPYLLAGLCAGGVIAFEMARQLQEEGERTLYVGIMDAADTQAEEKSFRIAHERLGRFLEAFADDGSGKPALVRVATALPKMARKAANFVHYEISTRLGRLKDARKLAQLRQGGDATADAGSSGGDAEAIPYLRLYEQAHREHVPEGVFRGGEVVLYRAMKGEDVPGDQAYVEQFVDPLFGWSTRVDGPVKAVDVPGGHSSMLQEPHVRLLAEAMNLHLEQALAAQPPVTGTAATTAAAPAAAGATRRPVEVE